MPKAAIFDVDGTLIDTVDFHAEAWVRAFRRYGVEVGQDEVRRQIGKGGDQLMPVFLRIRRDGKRIVLASSGKADEIERYETIADIADLLDGATTSDDAERSKPHPDIFEAALARIAPLGPDDAVAVGDTPYDAEAAGKAGLRTIGLLCGGFPEADLRQAGCIEIYRDPEDLLKNYERSPLAA